MEIFITPFPFMDFNFPFILDPLACVRMYKYNQLITLVHDQLLWLVATYLLAIQIHNYS